MDAAGREDAADNINWLLTDRVKFFNDRKLYPLGIIIGGSALVGAVLAAPVMSGLAATLGWRSAFLAIAIPGPFVAIGVWMVTRPHVTAEASPSLERLNLSAAFGIAAQRNILLGLVGAVTLIGSTVAAAAFLPLYLNSLPAFTPSTKILFFVGMGVFHRVGGIALPALSDRVGRRPPDRRLPVFRTGSAGRRTHVAVNMVGSSGDGPGFPRVRSLHPHDLRGAGRDGARQNGRHHLRGAAFRR